ncbi:MAG TPA: M15 family metallopeptidase, partial [Candidatus Caenarcaniphilales bacterium]
MKPYQQLPIHECGESLVAIPKDQFAFQQPHLYQSLGAPYGDASPFWLRESVLKRLIDAQAHLQQRCSNWRIQIFDAYRPVAVQQFMIEHTLAEIAQAQGLNSQHLSASQRQALLEQVYQIWAVPSLDPAMPPPHSTGGAVDVSLVDSAGQVVFMGSPIDELSERS